MHLPPAMRTAGKLPLLTAIEIELPPDAEVENLPAGFDVLPSPDRSRAFGDLWLRERRSLALRVPSAVVRPEWNLLLNPAHPDMARVRVLRAEPFALDPRLAP